MSSRDSSSEMDEVDLTPEQARALEQLLELTDGADIDVAKGVLGSVDWNVERAAELVFGQQPANGSASQAPAVTLNEPTFQTFDVDDSAQGMGDETEGLLGRNPGPERPQPSGSAILRPLFSLISVPFNILFSVFRFIFSVLRIPFPFSSTLGPLRFSSLNFYRPLSGSSNGQRRRGPDAWIRELEEETGAVSIAMQGGNRPRASGVSLNPQQSSVSARTGAGPSSDVAGSSGMADGHDGSTKYLPDFVVCSYEEMLRRCQSEFRIGCVVLVSEEHDDVPEFKRSTLTDYPFVKALYDNNIIVWGGDVRDREAWSASEKLQATTYPFVAFVALQPRRSPSSTSTLNNSNQPTQLTVLSRHQGPSKSYSSSSSAPTSAATLLAHLENQLLPRVNPFLNRLIHAQEQRAHDRRLREEQDRAYQESARRDKERILKSMEEARLKKEREERERMEEERRRKEEEDRIRREKEEREARERVRGDVRSWMARHVVPGASKTAGGKVLRLAVRMPDGSRVLHSLSDETSLTGLFAIVDVALGGNGVDGDAGVTVDGLPGDGHDAETKLEDYILRAPAESVEQSFWHFRLATAYPRVEILWKAGAKLRDVDALRGGGQIVVEKISVAHRANGNGKAKATAVDEDEDDGYRTEDSE
ncbi:hypothetical protein CVT24_005409 [Panaeolus cyanescens]|uniref:UAS domain-containing protein n=1 Tax=Panaeolus cyanescens TaxID=181874 RepID=A0A409Y8J8_9AGAR|nr:hypothetical protein CVT24_005409 [Panaeolus cyanescens]